MSKGHDPQSFVLVMVLNILIWAIIIRLFIIWMYS